MRLMMMMKLLFLINAKMRAATNAALFGEGILVTLNATKLIMYWGGYEYYNSISFN